MASIHLRGEFGSKTHEKSKKNKITTLYTMVLVLIQILPLLFAFVSWKKHTTLSICLSVTSALSNL